MARPSYDEVRKLVSRHPADPEIFAPLVSGKNPDGTDFTLPVSLTAEQNQIAQTFDEYAARNGYQKDAFSGEIAVPTAGETTLINLLVPAGETWYRRRGTYAITGARVGRFRRYRTNSGGAEAERNMIVNQVNTSNEFEAFEKYSAGDRIRITIVADALAATGDLASVLIQYIALPFVE